MSNKLSPHKAIQIKRYDVLSRMAIGSLIAIALMLLLFSGTPDSSAGSLTAETLVTPKATATPAEPELVEREATFTVGDIGQFSRPPSLTVQRVETDGTVIILDEGFEGSWPPPGWVAQPNWGVSTCRAFAGSKSAWVEGSAGLACGSNYYNDENAFLIYGPFSLADATAASFAYQLWLNTYHGDYLCPVASLNGFDFYGICWYGTSNGWVQEDLDLTGVPVLGNLAGQPAVWIALVWSTNLASVKPEGAFIDEVQVTKTIGGPTVTPTPTDTPTRTPTVTRTPTPTPTPLPTPGWWWGIEEVYDRAGDFTSLTLDGAGHPYISFYDIFYLELANWDGSAWHVEMVDYASFAGEYPSLALDGADRPHIAYYHGFTTNDLKYASWDGFTWQKETVDSEGDVGKHTSQALDGSGYAHVSYYDDTNDNLKYAYQDASGWHIETVDSEGNVGQYTSLALDEDGYPHISYYDGQYPGALKYAYQDAAGWHIKTVDSAGWVGYYTSLALDAGGNPHISYYSSSPTCDLKYAHWDGNVWNIETVDSAGSCTSYYYLSNSSLALDDAGYPHISYYNPNQHALWYAHKDETTWHTEIVEGGDVGKGNSLALNAAGQPLISYVDDTSDNLKFARWLDTPLPTPTPTPTSTSTPTPVPTGQAKSHSPELAPAAGGGVVVVWYDDRLGPYSDVAFARGLGLDGNTLWPDDVRVSAGPGTYDEMYPAIATDDNGDSFVVWYSGGDIYAQKSDPDGNHLWSTDTLVDGWPSNGQTPRVGLDQSSNWYVLWKEYFDDCTYSGPDGYWSGSCSLLHVRKSGFEPYDIHVRDYFIAGYIYSGAYWPDIAVDPAGNSRLVWQQGWSNEDSNIFGTSLDANGNHRWPNVVRINSDTESAPQEHPRVAVNAAGDTYFVWADKRNGNWDIYAQKLDVNVGHRLWANDVRVNSDAMGVDQTEPDLTIDTDGYIYVVWTDKRNGVADIYGQKLRPDGTRMWSPDLQINATNLADARSKPVITVDSTGSLYIAWESQLGNQYDIFMQSYTTDGTRRWAADVVVEGQPPTPPPTSTPTLTPTATSTPTVTATPTPTATPVQPWMAWADPDTPLLVGPHGRQVTINYGNIHTPATFAATLSGPVVFADDSQGLTANITDANGSYTLHLKPAIDATPGATFTLEVTLTDLRLQSVGTVAWEVYLPLIHKNAP